MKTAITILIVLVCGAVGYLSYDWQVQTKKIAAEPSISLYSWTDAEGAKHFTDTAPPPGAKNIEATKGYNYIEPPLAVKIKDKTIEFFKRIKSKLFKKERQRKKQRG
jgi:hypothetical protein